jgi:hypothetical protein
VALKHPPGRFRKRRTEQSLRCPRRTDKRVGARTDVAVVRRIEGRAIFEKDLTRAALEEMRGCRRESRNRLACWRDPRPQSDNDRLAVA